MENLVETIKTINSKFNSEFWMDFEITSLQNDNLRIKASTDFCYYHLLEIELMEVSYFQGPTNWGSSPNKKPLVEIFSTEETSVLIRDYKFDVPRIAIAFNSDKNFRVIVAANSIQANFDVVYYYLRENLGPNERIGENILK